MKYEKIGFSYSPIGKLDRFSFYIESFEVTLFIFPYTTNNFYTIYSFNTLPEHIHNYLLSIGDNYQAPSIEDLKIQISTRIEKYIKLYVFS